MTEKEFLNNVTKLMYDKQAKINKIADLNYPAPTSGWGKYYSPDMTMQDVENAVNDRYREAIMRQEPTNEKKIELFKIIGSNKSENLDANAVSNQYGKKYLRELTDEDRIDLASKKGWSLEDTNQRINDAIDKKIADNAKKVMEETKDDTMLAKQYYLAKFNGDEETMKKIEEKLGDRASYVLDKTPIPWYAKGARIAGDWLGGSTQMDKYREQIMSGEGSDDFFDTSRNNSLLADVAFAGVTAWNPGSRFAGPVVKKVGSGVGKVATKAGLGAAEGVGAEALRQGLSDEDFNVTKMGVNSVSEATIPTAIEVGASKFAKVPVIGQMIQQVSSGIRKGADEDQIFLEASKAKKELLNEKKNLNTSYTSSNGGFSMRTGNTNNSNLIDEKVRRSSNRNSSIAQFSSEYDEALKNATESAREAAESYAKVKNLTPDQADVYARTRESIAHEKFIRENGDRLTYINKRIDASVKDIDDIMHSTGKDAYTLRMDIANDLDFPDKKVRGIKETKRQERTLSSNQWEKKLADSYDIPGMRSKIGKEIASASDRTPVILSNAASKKATPETNEEKYKRWQKGYVKFEEMQSPEYANFKAQNLKNMLLAD